MNWTHAISSWLAGSTRKHELSETRTLWNETEALWHASPPAREHVSRFALELVAKGPMARTDRIPATPILVACCVAAEQLLTAEDIGPLEAEWRLIEADAAVALNVRNMLARRRCWAAGFDRMMGVFASPLAENYLTLFEALPDSCFGEWRDDEVFSVPLIELLENPAEAIDRLLLAPYNDDTLRFDMFRGLRERLVQNLLVASGFRPDDNPHERTDRLIGAMSQRGKSPNELLDLYLSGTPFHALLSVPVPFHVPAEARFEHCHIVGGTGHGKTQLLQRLIHADLVAAKEDGRSVVVIDSQGDLINKLLRLDLFDPEAPDSLADRLVLIDPADVEFPAALNLFDAHLDRLAEYRPVDRERVLNGVIELYEVFFGSLLGAELTQKQGVIFRYLARLMLTIPGASIHTLMQLMEDGRPFKPHMDGLDGSARHFFETEFFHPSFAATKKQILRRLWGVLSTPAFERMFAQPTNKLDLFDALQGGKIILVSTAKDLLKEEGSALLGRFFIAMLTQAALERSTVAEDDRTPTYVYVDEAQEYFDDRVETILSQARKYMVAIHAAHQTLDQLSPRLRAAFNSNTSFKCVGGVSAKDARSLADELRTSSGFIESMKRRPDRTEFAAWLKHQTPHAIRLTVPLGFLERQPLLSEEAFGTLIEANRARYCGTLDEVAGFAALPSPDTAGDKEAYAFERPSLAAMPPPAAAPRPDEESPLRAAAPEPPVTPRARAAPQPRELGKGGPQHRYVQHLVKGLAEERGFRAVIEEQVQGGAVDVGLHREGLSIACEISVTSTADYETRNLAKCLQGNFAWVFAIAGTPKRLRVIEALARGRLPEADIARVAFLTPDQVSAALDAFAIPADEPTVVRGYKVKVSRTVLGADDARDRRAAIARVLAKSLKTLPEA